MHYPSGRLASISPGTTETSASAIAKRSSRAANPDTCSSSRAAAPPGAACAPPFAQKQECTDRLGACERDRLPRRV